MLRTEEDRICAAACQRFELQYPIEFKLLFHIPNGGKRSKAQAGIFKAMGVKPGVSDYFYMQPRGGFHGLWLEVKTSTGDLSRDQRLFLQLARQKGYAAIVTYGLEEMWEVLDHWANDRTDKLALYLTTHSKHRRRPTEILPEQKTGDQGGGRAG